MRKTLGSAVLAMGLLVIVAATWGAGPQKSNVAWQPNLHAAHKVSQKTGKPMLLVFGAEWCTFCKKLESQTLGNENLAKYINMNFVPVHIDVDEEPKVGEILEVSKLPCTIVLSPEADLLGRYEGFCQPNQFHQKLTAAQKLHREVQQTGGQR